MKKAIFLLALGIFGMTSAQPAYLVPERGETYQADYVVVGMGACGAGVARLLSEGGKNSVIGLEAGANQDDDGPIRDSMKSFDLEPSYYATYFYQQEQLPETFNGVQYHYTTGFLWGGGSSINGEQYVQGSNKNFQRWENLLGPKWSVKKIRAAYKKLENYNGMTTNPYARGKKGPVDIRQTPQTPTNMAQKFVSAVAAATGFPEILDYNDPNTPMGPFTRWQLYQHPDGTRESSSTAYLKGLLAVQEIERGQQSLNVISKASAQRVLFSKHKKAIGVEFKHDGKICKALAKKKVILCSGLFSSKLLMLSGIGPQELLQSQGVDLVYPNPNVGKNLVNHPMITVVFTANPQDAGVPVEDPNALYVGGAFLPNPTAGSDPTIRDVQLIGTSQEQGTFMVSALLLNPISRGVSNIQSNDPLKPVLATDAVLTSAVDVESFKNIFKIYIKNIATQLASIDPSYQLISPTMSEIDNDAALMAYIMSNVNIPHHWMGSCRMGPQDGGCVVDARGHVYGVQHLVVADASIAPFPNDGNTSAPAFMIGRMISHQILEENHTK